MSMPYSRHGLTPRDRRLQRALEIVPGATSWTILIGMPLMSFLFPMTAASIVIAFNLYWLLRLAHSTIFLVLSYVLLQSESRTDWLARIADLGALPAWAPRPCAFSWRERVSHWAHRQRVASLRAAASPPPALEDIHHLVVIPIAKETADVVEPGLRSLGGQQFPITRILVVLAVEGRAAPEVRADAQRLAAQYRDRFRDVIVALHPDGVPGEARVKGANASYAARTAADWFTAHGIPHEHVIASCFDADTVVSQNYFSCLTYHFMAEPQRQRASFQPIPVYHNNIWQAPGFARVLDVGSSFFQLIEATNPETLVTFSSHSMSFKALVDVGYWPIDMISDDSAIFWKAYLHFEGDYRVVPMYTTVSMDVVTAATWWTTMTSLYKQKRRWAWGVENFPLIMRGFLATSRIPLRERAMHMLKMYESHVAWATWGFMLTVFNWLPALFAGREFSSTVLYFSAPRITAVIFNLAGVALVTTVGLSTLLLPRPPSRIPMLRRILHAFEWMLVPIITLFFSAIPALDAQTRLMFGKSLVFWVAGKGKTMGNR
jgi:hypothetical protein